MTIYNLSASDPLVSQSNENLCNIEGWVLNFCKTFSGVMQSFFASFASKAVPTKLAYSFFKECIQRPATNVPRDP